MLLKGKHYSHSFSEGKDKYVVPEIASHSSPCALNLALRDNNFNKIKNLKSYFLIDQLSIKHGRRYYFFRDRKINRGLALFTIEGNIKGVFMSKKIKQKGFSRASGVALPRISF